MAVYLILGWIEPILATKYLTPIFLFAFKCIFDGGDGKKYCEVFFISKFVDNI